MKKLPVLLGMLFLLFVASSCSDYLYPSGKGAKRAYKKTLKEKRKGYNHFTPVKLSLDSLKVKQWVAPSPNFNIRQPDLVIIHHTAQEGCKISLKTLTRANTNRKVSAHFLICGDGTIYQLVDEKYRAWHAGASRWGNMQDINSVSLGIEIDNDGHEPFSSAQIKSLLVLLSSIENRYGIRRGNFIGHADVAPTRKQDPSVYFPWRTLAAHGFGYAVDAYLPPVPEGFNVIAALRLIGYDIRDKKAAIIAFKRHYIQTDLDPSFTPLQKRMLYNIYLKYLQE
ncbi:MAG TPA: N-acetylmuramoyl-L-alanine amidase [Chitinophagaceae bacterium]|nr:N-acetylmuramoyl-L-alanine amidase [Chitinophagaceae bacterium]